MNEANLIQDLAVIMLIAGFITVLFHRLKQPVVLGYILAGIIIGPHTPPIGFIHDEKIIKTLAELGVIFLMLSLGLEFNLRKLKKVGIPATVAALTEIVIMILLGYEIGAFFHWKNMDALFLGGILAISSTTIIVKVIGELKLRKENFVQLIFGILVIEDILGIGLLALLSSIAITGAVSVIEVSATLGKLLLFLVITLLIGILTIPRLLSYVAKFGSNEMLLVTVLGLCFGFCLLVIKFNYSVVLGAFIVGTLIAESSQAKDIERLIKPIRNMFSAIFFVSVGLLLDPQVLVDYTVPIIVIAIAVVLGKVLTCSFGAFITGNDGRTSLRVGMGLAQIGEFSFIIAALGTALHVTSHFLYSIAVAVSLITTVLTPYLIKFADPLALSLAKIMPTGWVDVFAVYTDWIKNIRPQEDQIELTRIIKRGLVQVLINLMIVVAIFSSGAYLATTEIANLINVVAVAEVKKIIIWGLALLLSLPFLIAAYRKLNGLSMILAELSVKEKVMGRFTEHVRRIISGVIPIVAIVGIIVLVCALSISILPSIEFLLLILLIGIILAAFLWRWFIKLHSKLQISLLEAMEKGKNPD